MKANRNSLLGAGLFNLLSPLPLMLLSIFFSWIIFFGIGYALYGLEDTPDWLLYLSLLPTQISPLCALSGIIRGILRRREKHAVTCILLSVIGLLETLGLFIVMMYLGATY